MGEPAKVEEPSFLETMSEMYQLFGQRRMVEVLGFAVLAGYVMRGDDGPAEVREKLMQMGFSRAAVYRFTKDMTKLCRSLEESQGETITMSGILREINSRDTSQG